MNTKYNNLIGERLHRMEFMESLQEDIFNFIKSFIENKPIGEYKIIYDKENDYFNKLNIFIKISANENNKQTKINGNYYNESGLIGGKIDSPILIINISQALNEENNNSFLETVVVHETTHLYDDWQRMRNGHKPIVIDNSLSRKNEIAANLIKNYRGLLNTIGWCIYLDFFVENNAFVNQSIAELKRLNANKENVRAKIKSTIAYRNYKKIKIDINYYLNRESNEDLMVINNFVINNNLNKIVPCLDLDNFDCNLYKTKLLNWTDAIFNRFIRRYAGIVIYYIEKQK